MRHVDDLPEIDPLDPGFVKDRLAGLNAVREQSPVARSTRGIEVLGYEAVTAVFQDRSTRDGVPFLMEMMGLDPKTVTRRGRTLTLSEGDEHREIRGVLSKWFTPKRVSELRQGVVDLVEGLVEPITAGGGGDFFAEVARGVPGPVFCWMIGAPDDRAEDLFGLSETLLLAFSGDPEHAEAVNAAGKAMGRFVDELMEDKRRSPGDDLMTIMLAAADAGTITVDDVRSLAFEMLGASTDNTANSAGLAIGLLSEAPDQWAAVRADQDLVPRAIEETLRVDPTVVEAIKYSDAGTSVLDVEVPPESMLWLSVLAANHDGSVFADPESFDVSRRHPRPQLNFGVGRHFCLGAALARMELAAILGVVADRWHTIEPAGPADVDRSYGAKVRSMPITVTGV